MPPPWLNYPVVLPGDLSKRTEQEYPAWRGSCFCSRIHSSAYCECVDGTQRDYLQGFNAKALDRIPVSSFLSTGQFLSWPLLSAVLAAFLFIGPLSSAFSTLKTL